MRANMYIIYNPQISDNFNGTDSENNYAYHCISIIVSRFTVSVTNIVTRHPHPFHDENREVTNRLAL